MYIFVSFLEESFKERRSAGFRKSIWTKKVGHESRKTDNHTEEEENMKSENVIKMLNAAEKTHIKRFF